jgi:phage gp46-like protein
MRISIRRDDPRAPDPYLLWDTVWNDDLGGGDWTLADPAIARNHGGLRASDGIATAVVLGLFTDRACPANHPLARYAGDDRRGWWGDGVDVQTARGERPLGSLLWLLERAVVNDAMARWAEAFARDGLAPLLDAGEAVRLDVVATPYPARNTMALGVKLYGRDGAALFDRAFDLVWTQRGF